MKTITVREFRENISKYAEMAVKQEVIVEQDNGKAFAIVPLKASEKPVYSEAFVKRIQDALESVKKGNYTVIKDTNNIWADIVS